MSKRLVRLLSTKRDIPSLQGLNQCSRYDVDFLETCDWVNGLMKRLETDELKPGKAFVAPTDQFIVLETKSTETYDFTKTVRNNHLQVYVDVQKLPLTKEEKHKFLHLAQQHYNPYEQTVKFNMTQSLTNAVNDNVDVLRSKKEADIRIEQMLESCKKDQFTDIKLNLTHVKRKRTQPQFPSKWLSQAN
ncbi:hypothetical protein EDD86DRAFT_215130 [Gorgonomyces haynaldii]|nr:hypothetical protein EDD86DRAFT_215130 [Gorgonomyces haynaldii]